MRVTDLFFFFIDTATTEIYTLSLHDALPIFLGDARYWRALNEAQLERFDAAWADIEESAKLMINADVPKLAGLIAYRRRSEEHTSELQSHVNLVCRLLLEKKKK